MKRMTDQNNSQWINEKGEGVQFGGGELEKDDRAECQRIEFIAELGWQTHIAWERIIGESPKLDWRDLSINQKSVVCQGVQWLVEHPTSSVSVQHDAWRARMASDGPRDTPHENMVPFDELPFSQKMKARLWRHIIFAVLG
jgi:hypothetical protein